MPSSFIKRAASKLLRQMKTSFRLWYQAAAIRPYVDAGHYRSQWSGGSKIYEAAHHYLTNGSHAGLTPSPFFSPEFYLASNSDVTDSGVDPFVHFVRHGLDEGRSPHPLIDIRWVAAEAGCTCREAYLSIAKGDDISPNQFFDAAWYRKHYDVPVVQSSLGHYLSLKERNDIRTSPRFDAEWFAKTAIGKENASEAGPVQTALFSKHFTLTEDLRLRLRRFGVKEPSNLQALIDDGLAVEYEVLPAPIKAEIEDRARQSNVTFSILVPTWNRREHLMRAIESILAQTYRRFEAIVVDDGSIDGTIEMVQSRYAEEIAQGIIKYLPSEHFGAAAARNFGLRSSTADFIAYLDSDNEWRPTHLMCLAAALHIAPTAEVVYTPIFVKDKSSGQNFTLAKVYDRRRLLEANFIDLNGFAHSRAAYLRHGGFDSKSDAFD